MKNLFILLLVFAFQNLHAQAIQSPSEEITMNFSLTSNGEPTYSVTYKGKQVINPSKMGLMFKDGTDFTKNFIILASENDSVDETWKPVLGEQSSIRDHYNQLTVHLAQGEKKLDIVFKVFDEGVAFRYEFPFEKNVDYFVISEETTEFNLTDDHKTFWIPGDYDSQEYNYTESKLSQIDISILDMENGIALKTIDNNYRVQSPLMMKSADGLYINIFEAAVNNYPVMHLDVDRENFKLISNLVPNAIGDKAYLRTPSTTPWRTIMVSDDAREIVSSKMILNLNEPNRIEDTSWIKPMKYVGIWWEMHVGVSTWDYAGSQNAQNSLTQELLP
ncbi:MAG TPA: glycoside hydrolase family 97 N-terminal domain-containing protein, partial [Aquaticitalea sp.]|nr:glycoside hydrolase family 97 N-terminal domain-containing protein [Aquaticitalea sp.]